MKLFGSLKSLSICFQLKLLRSQEFDVQNFWHLLLLPPHHHHQAHHLKFKWKTLNSVNRDGSLSIIFFTSPISHIIFLLFLFSIYCVICLGLSPSFRVSSFLFLAFTFPTSSYPYLFYFLFYLFIVSSIFVFLILYFYLSLSIIFFFSRSGFSFPYLIFSPFLLFLKLISLPFASWFTVVPQRQFLLEILSIFSPLPSLYL